MRLSIKKTGMKLDAIRREYKFAELSRKSIDKNPMTQIGIWLKEALESNVNEPTAMSVVTVGTDGFPQSRIVLLKDLTNEGLIFFTNYLSEKGQAIEHSPKIGLHMYWSEMDRQIRISGYAEKTSDTVSEKYFKSRPLLSQIAAAVSNQSEEVSGRGFLVNRFFDLQDQLKGNPPARPKNWGGYLVKPVKIEFWQGRENRLHDRILYEKTGENWKIKRLSP